MFSSFKSKKEECMRWITDVDVSGKTVFVRCDCNVPVANGRVLDARRIDASLDTIQYIRSRGGRVVLGTHLGRPKGHEKEFSLKPVQTSLAKKLRVPVTLITEYPSLESLRQVHTSEPGRVFLLENLRYHAGETENSEVFARSLADYADIYVNDAFSNSHRKHASMVAITRFLPSYGGMSLGRELNMLQALNKPKRPFVIVLGGAKLSTKLGLLKDLVLRADAILLGGAMIFTAYRALGYAVGTSLVEENLEANVKHLLASKKIVLPVDIVVQNTNASSQIVDYQAIPDDSKGLDIGPKSIQLFHNVLQEAQTIFWNGPMGLFEESAYRKGTRGIITALLANTNAYTLVGGGDTNYALDLCKAYNKFSHVLLGGGASLQYLQCEALPALQVLR